MSNVRKPTSNPIFPILFLPMTFAFLVCKPTTNPNPVVNAWIPFLFAYLCFPAKVREG